ncbi:MAG: hypothetical protein RR356_06205 [Bacteroidales bacterium]
MFNVPVLLVIYNKVVETHNLFQIIKSIQPSKLYVAADGAVRDEKLDYVTCLRTRSVIMPEWPCNLNLMFKEEHLGKSKMIFQAINWFFENEEEGIILFDDCIPREDFFYYCEQLLEKYRDSDQIFHIGANNFQKRDTKRNKKRNKRGDGSYYFSAYAHTWGFATWRNKWKGFDLKMLELDGVNFNKLLTNYMKKSKEKMYWLRRYNILRKHQLNIWEYQYNFHIWHQGGLCIVPNVNLVTNVGFKNRKRRIRKLMKNTFPILPISHPEKIIQNKHADHYVFKHVYNRAFIKIFADWINAMLLGKEIKL